MHQAIPAALAAATAATAYKPNSYMSLRKILKKTEPGVIKICRLEQPVRYLQIIASVLPRELVLEQNVLSDMSDDDIAAHLLILQKLSKHKEEEPENPADESTKH